MRASAAGSGSAPCIETSMTPSTWPAGDELLHPRVAVGRAGEHEHDLLVGRLQLAG